MKYATYPQVGLGAVGPQARAASSYKARMAALDARLRAAADALMASNRQWGQQSTSPQHQQDVIAFQNTVNATIAPGTLVVTGVYDAPTQAVLAKFVAGGYKSIGLGADEEPGLASPRPLMYATYPRPGVLDTTVRSDQFYRTGLGAPGDNASDVTISDAAAMNDALTANGYRQADMGLYRAFQQDVGLSPDGYPGMNTMRALQNVIGQTTLSMTTVPRYAWSAANGKWDGVNAPLWSTWAPGTPPPSGNTSTTTTTTTTTTSKASSALPWALAAAFLAVGGVGTAIIYKKGHKGGALKRSPFRRSRARHGRRSYARA